jgi:hypothetical protein
MWKHTLDQAQVLDERRFDPEDEMDSLGSMGPQDK